MPLLKVEAGGRCHRRVEGMAARQHLEGDLRERIDVAGRGQRQAGDMLRAHVAASAHGHVLGGRRRAVLGDLGCAEIQQFGADLPAPTLFVMAISEFFVAYWWLTFGVIGGGFYFFMQAWKRSEKMQQVMDRVLLKMPIFGALIDKSCVARWTRTLSTMFAAGVPLVEALDSVGGASGNSVYAMATDRIQQEVSTGTSLTAAMGNANVFPSMVLQMCAIGEESGSIDHMLSKAADFYEAEVDEMVAGLSSLMEPIIIVFLGTIIGGIVVSMYLPIFKLGQVV